MKKETKCIHSGTYIDPNTGGVNTPIFTSSAYKYIDSGPHTYPRYFNLPNQKAVIDKLCALEGAEDGLLFSSGMAAITTTFFSLTQQGDHVVLQDGLYGGTHEFITQQLKQFGIDYSFVPATVDNIAQAITEKTKLIYIESPTNPLLKITDLVKVAELGKQKNIVTVIDNTFASPINQNPLLLGLDIVIHSGTKYLGGHSDICCGVALSSKDLIQKTRVTAQRFGGSLNAATCSLLERSLKTLALRVERQTENASKIALHLESNPMVRSVLYPGLSQHPENDIAKRQMQDFGAILSFELGNDAASSSGFMRQLKLITPALSLGGVETTICCPALTSHSKMLAEERKRIGITDGLLRLSVGIEHTDDLIEDIEQALSAYA